MMVAARRAFALQAGLSANRGVNRFGAMNQVSEIQPLE